MSQATYPYVYDAAQVRLAEFGAHLLELEEADLSTDLPTRQLIDLHLGLETAARLPAGPDQRTVLGDLIERYGLGAVGIDPFLRAQLPTLAATGSTVRQFVLSVNGFVVTIGGFAVGVGAELVATPIAEKALPTQAGPEPTPAPVEVVTPPVVTLPSTTSFVNQTSVTVVHNLGRRPLVQVVDLNGQEIDASMVSDLNSVTVTFSQPLSGTISLY